MRSYSAVITDDLHNALFSALIRADEQEDLCFATYRPSRGADRLTGILSDIILPEDNERSVHGNVGFFPNYFERVLKIAAERKEGIAFLHSHLGPGWQGMSADDVRAETRMAPAVMAVTGLPLLGLTLGTDGAWSARFWAKDLEVKRKYNRQWCEGVRVIGKGLKITFNDALLPARFDTAKQLRTISAWGGQTQEGLSRLRAGIVGVGSVGSIVAEILSRTGIASFTLIDFDGVEEKNLDRLTNVFATDIGTAKVQVIADAIRMSAAAPTVTINTCEYSICEREGFEAALDCDVLFSCVDRPWPRQVLNFIAYAHLIPVIDGGILVRTNKSNTRLLGADWKTQVVGYQRACLECLGQFKTENATLEKAGCFDDPEYIKGMTKTSQPDVHENVFAFSSHLASMEVLQMLNLFISHSGISDVGQQMYHFVTGALDVDRSLMCHKSCFFQSIVGKGDHSGVTVYANHPVAEEARNKRGEAYTAEQNGDPEKQSWNRLWKWVVSLFRV